MSSPSYQTARARQPSPESLAIDLVVFRANMTNEIRQNHQNDHQNTDLLPRVINLNDDFQQDVVLIRREQRRQREKHRQCAVSQLASPPESPPKPPRICLLVNGQRPPLFGRIPSLPLPESRSCPLLPKIQPRLRPTERPRRTRKRPEQVRAEAIARGALTILDRPRKKLITLGKGPGSLKMWVYDTDAKANDN